MYTQCHLTESDMHIISSYFEAPKPSLHQNKTDTETVEISPEN